MARRKKTTFEAKENLHYIQLSGGFCYPGKRRLLEAVQQGPQTVQLRFGEAKGVEAVDPALNQGYQTSDKKSIIGFFNGEAVGHLAMLKDLESFTSGGKVYEFSTADKVAKMIEETAEKEITATVSENAGTLFIGVIKEKVKVSDEEMDSIVEGISSGTSTDKKTVGEIIKYLEANSVNQNIISRIVDGYKKYPATVAKKIPMKPRVPYVDTKGILQKTLAYAAIGQHMLFDGDRGVGKNVLCETIAWVLQRPLYEFSLNSEQDNVSLLGGKTFKTDSSILDKAAFIENLKKARDYLRGGEKCDNPDEIVSAIQTIAEMMGGPKNIEFEANSIIQALENGGILVLDEFNTAVSSVMSLFNSMLDGRGRIDVPGYKLVSAHCNFLCIATQNSDYQGTFQTNEATVDRFVRIVFPALDDIRSMIRKHVPGINNALLSRIGKVYESVQKSVQAAQINERALSIRGFVTAAKAITELELNPLQTLIDCVAQKGTDESEREAIKNIIELHIRD